MAACMHPVVSATDQAPLACEAHRAFVFLPFQLPVDTDADEHVRSSAAQALYRAVAQATPGSAGPAWQRVERMQARHGLHPELLPVVDQILHGGPQTTEKHRFYGLPPLTLASHLANVQYLVSFKPQARARLAQAGVSAEHVLVRVAGATLYTFHTGVLLIVVNLTFTLPGHKSRAMPAALLLEGLCAVAHAADRASDLVTVETQERQLLEPLPVGERVVLDRSANYAARRWRPQDGEAQSGPLRPRRLLASVPVEGVGGAASGPHCLVLESGPQPRQLASVVTGWLSSEGQPLARPAFKEEHCRLFTLVAGVFEPALPTEALPELAYRLSRRFGADYCVAPAEVASEVVQPFDNICHAVATQGGAVAVRKTGVPFVDQFINAALLSAYVPMAVLSYHEYVYLRELSQGRALLPAEGEPHAARKRLRQLRLALAGFRLYLRFSHISDIDHHNQVHAAWRRQLGLDCLLQELALDVHEGEELLEQIHHEKEHERAEYWRKWGAIGLMLASFAVLLHVAEVITELLFPSRRWWIHLLQGGGREWNEVKEIDSLRPVVEFFEHAHLLEYGLFGVTLLLGIALGYVAYRAGGKGGGGH